MKHPILLLTLILTVCSAQAARFTYTSDNLVLGGTFVRDSLRTIALDDLPQPHPASKAALRDATPLAARLWDIALSDCESNLVSSDRGTYFGAGTTFGTHLYTRDVSFSAILSLNVLYPEQVLGSLRLASELRLKLGFVTPAGYTPDEIKAPWKVHRPDEERMTEEKTVAWITRRSDDVVWMWAVYDLFGKNPHMADWEWFYDTGRRSFEELYSYFYDPTDGLYRGQAAFVDIHYPQRKVTGYPQDISVTDCLILKALSTNCLYVKALEAMAVAARKTGRKTEARDWTTRRDALKGAIIANLRFADGTFAYFKHGNGTLEPRRDALGSALAVLCGVVRGRDAKACLSGYPVEWAGVPLFHPFYKRTHNYHNLTAWPFVDTFFLWAGEVAGEGDRTGLNAAILARARLEDGTFRELTDWQTRLPKGSKNQLWSAAAYLNVCLRAGLVVKPSKS